MRRRVNRISGWNVRGKTSRLDELRAASSSHYLALHAGELREKKCHRGFVIAKRFRSDAFEAIHSAASGLRSVRLIDKTMMRKYDGLCVMFNPPYPGVTLP